MTDAVVALAEKIAGTETVFVKMMNDKANELGLKDTHFVNPHGLDSENHYSSAYDMSVIARELVKHEKVLEYTSIYETYLRENLKTKIWLVNTNKLVRFYDGVDGLKTGFTNKAGYCLTATAKKNNMRIIAVVMGEPDSKTRNKEVSEMLDYAYAQYMITTIVKENQVLDTIEIEKAKENVMKYVDNDTIAVNIDCIYSTKPRTDIPLSNKVGNFKIVDESGNDIYFKGTNYVWRNELGIQLSPHLKGVPKILQDTYDIETGQQTREPDYIFNEKGEIIRNESSDKRAYS